MFTKFMKRAMVLCTVMAAIVIGMAGPAQAANKTIILSDIDGRMLGYMVFYDQEPSKFKVCDTQRDGYTVTGAVYRGNNIQGSTTDGDDQGCNFMYFRFKGDQMRLWWDGPGNIGTFAFI